MQYFIFRRHFNDVFMFIIIVLIAIVKFIASIHYKNVLFTYRFTTFKKGMLFAPNF